MTDEREVELMRSWTANADSWTRAVRSRSIDSRHLVTDDAVIDAIDAVGGTRILDVGCGEGWLARRLTETGRQVVGFDGSARLIERAREQGGATYQALDYETFSSEPSRVGSAFDVAVASFSLLGESVAELFRALRRVVKPEGRLVIQTVHPGGVGDADGWQEERYEPLAPLPFAPMPWFFRTLETWMRELADSGWHIDDVREPVHPRTGEPASLILIASIERVEIDDGRSSQG